MEAYPEQRFTDLTQIGEGSYGLVFHAHDHTTKQHVALKEIKTTPGLECLPHFLLRELDVLQKLKGHKNIVTL
jgi:serine/threonine protein kinase